MNLDVREKMEEFLRSKRLRRTGQREVIIDAAFGTKEHFTADDLIRMAKKRDASVSRATVYRTLPLLVESGLLREVDLGMDQKYYDPNYVDHPNHNHLICTDCNKVVEFEDDHINVLEDCITRRLGFTPTAKTIRIEATCESFNKSGHCKNRA